MRDPDYGEQWDPGFWNNSDERKFFWRRTIEMIFLYEPQLLEESQRCDALIQQDYIHSCGVLFSSDVPSAVCFVIDHLSRQRELKHQFRAGYGAPNHFEQPWFGDYDYPRDVFDMVYW